MSQLEVDLNIQNVADEILNRIESHPKTYNQDFWTTAADVGSLSEIGESLPYLGQDVPDWECGTQACLAGHIVSAAYYLLPMSFKLPNDWYISDAAAKLFRMENQEMFEYDRTRSEVIEWLTLIAVEGLSADEATREVLYSDDPELFYA